MSRTSAFASNVLSSGLLQIINILVAFLVPRMIIANYGSEINGLVTSLTQFISYFNLAEAGISAAAIFALYAPLASSDSRGVNSIVSSAKRMYYKAGCIFLGLVVVLGATYPLFVQSVPLDSARLFVLVLALGAVGYLDFFMLAKYRVLLTATKKNWVIQLATCVYKIAYGATIFVLATARVDIVLVYVAAILPIVIRALILIGYAKKKYALVDYSSKDTVDIPQRWDAFYLQILGVVQSGAPVVLATLILQDLAEVSVFSIYLLVANGVMMICSTLTGGTQAIFGELIVKKEKTRLQKRFSELQTLCYGLNASSCGVAVVMIVPFVLLYAGSVSDGVDYGDAAIGFTAILNVFLYHLKTPQGLMVVAAGHYRETRVQTTVQALILIIAGCILGLQFGAVGILAGSCLSNLYRAIDLMIYTPRKITGTQISKTAKAMLVSVISFSAVVALGFFLPPVINDWLDWICSAAIYALFAVLVSVLFSFALERNEVRGLARKATEIVRRRKKC